jgi:predicted transcriptional regulator
MTIIHQRITIVSSRKPRRNLNDELQWFGNSLGLFSLRDKDRSCFRLFIELLKAAKAHQALSSDALSERLKLTRGTTVHHLNKLMETGIVVREGNRYILRVDNLEYLIEELRRDSDRMFHDLQKIAKEIDGFLGL